MSFAYLSLFLVDVNLDLSESTEELLCINLVVSVEAIKVSEDSAQSPDGLSTSGIDLCPHLLKNLIYTKREGSAT